MGDHDPNPEQPEGVELTEIPDDKFTPVPSQDNEDPNPEAFDDSDEE